MKPGPMGLGSFSVKLETPRPSEANRSSQLARPQRRQGRPLPLGLKLVEIAAGSKKFSLDLISIKYSEIAWNQMIRLCGRQRDNDRNSKNITMIVDLSVQCCNKENTFLQYCKLYIDGTCSMAALESVIPPRVWADGLTMMVRRHGWHYFHGCEVFRHSARHNCRIQSWSFVAPYTFIIQNWRGGEGYLG